MSRKRGKNTRKRAGKPASRKPRAEVVYIGRFPSDAEVFALQDWFSQGVVVADDPEAAAALQGYRLALLAALLGELSGAARDLVRRGVLVADMAGAVVAVSDMKAAGRVRHAGAGESAGPEADRLRDVVRGMPGAGAALRYLGVAV